MSADSVFSERPRDLSRGLRSFTILFGVTALLAGLLSGPSAMAESTEPGPSTVEPAPTAPPETTNPTEPAPTADESAPTAPPETTNPTEPAPTADEPAPTAPEAVNVESPMILTDPEVRVEAGATVFTNGGQWRDAEKLEFIWSGADNVSLKTETLMVGSKSAFTIPAALRGSVLVVTVRGISASGSVSNPVSSRIDVLKGNFKTTWSGLISGKPIVGQRLSVAVPNLTPTGAVTYKWYRGLSEIGGAVSASYTATPADAAKKLSVKLTITGEGMNSLTLTSSTVTIANGTFSSAPAPAISGVAKVGTVLTANPGTWSPTGATLSYQWYRGSSAISGATARAYTASPADKGKYLKVRVRAAKAGYTSLDRWSVARLVAPGTIAAIRWPSISGTARYGQTLRVSQAWTSGSSVAYQWYSNGKPIAGATGSTRYLGTSLIGTRVAVRVTVSKVGYTTRQVTTPAVTIGKAFMVKKANPTISGTKQVGYTLATSNGSFSPAPSAYKYQWYRNGVSIPRATLRTYRLTTADSGKKVTVKVTALRTGYHNITAASGAVTIYAPPRTVIWTDGTYRVGTDIKPGLYKATGTGSTCYWETTSGFSGRLSEINNNHFGSARTYVQISPEDRGFKTSRCGTWTTAPATGANASKITADGTYRVGIDVRPGLYRISGTGASCYWETTSGFRGDLDEIIANDFAAANSYVEIPSSAKGFRVSRCGTLTRIP